MEKGQIDRQNKWKWAFLILVTLNLLLIISLSVSLFSNSKTTADQSVEQTGPVSPTSDQLQATVVLENGDIEALLSQALNASQNQSISSISVTEIISMTGQLSVLGIPVDYVVEAEPFPMEDGNLQLKVNSIQLGNLSLPLKQTLAIMANQFQSDLPLDVNPDDQYLIVRLDQLVSEQVDQIKVLQIDKDNKEYTIQLTIPKQNLLQ